MNRLKETWQEMSAATRRILIGVLLGAVAFVIVGILLISRDTTTQYTTLFTGLSQTEASDIVGLIQESGTQYLYDASTGTIQVEESQADQLRAEMLSQGYPKSGFTYDIYVNNSGIMATESDKQQYSLYDLQDRLGSTIRLFDGVQDAKVTIAQGEDDTYVLDSDGTTGTIEASASAVVTMQRGSTLTEENADAIRNLIARSVDGINFTNVAVFDAETMTEIGSSSDASSSTSKLVNDMTTEVENNIAANVKRVLGKLYEPGNVEVSVKGTLDMSSVISENTQYSVPVQEDEDDKVGLLHTEDDSSAYTGPNASAAAGVAGTDANADTPRYTVDDGTDGDGVSSFDTATSREWLYNTLKEQTETDAGRLTDCTVAVVIDTADNSVTDTDLINLIADAAGIARDQAANKITVVRTQITRDSDTTTVPVSEDEEEDPFAELLRKLILIAAIAVPVLLLLIILLVVRSKKKKKKAAAEAAALEEQAAAEAAAAEAAAAEEEEKEQKREMTEEEQENDLQMERGQQLKDDIKNFVDENPQVAAKLVQGWLREGDEIGGRKRTKK